MDWKVRSDTRNIALPTVFPHPTTHACSYYTWCEEEN